MEALPRNFFAVDRDRSIPISLGSERATATSKATARSGRRRSESSSSPAVLTRYALGILAL